jgi:hypothetical protein
MIGGVGDGVGQCSEVGYTVSAITVSGLVVFDIATASASARRYNHRHLAVAPRVDVRNGSYGFAASWSFGRSSRLPARSYAAPAHKSPGTAFVLSLTSTAAPILLGAAIQDDAGAVLVFSGLLIGPSVGHFYAGQVGRGLGTFGLRAAGTVVGLYWIVACMDD